MTKKAKLYKTNGVVTDIQPKNGKDFSLKELQSYVGGTIDIQALPSGRVLVLNDNGKIDGLPKNEEATFVWKMEYPITRYPVNNDELIVGDVIICDSKLIK